MAIKDFVWEKGEERWKTKWVPLGEGMVDFKRYVHEIGPVLDSVPISIHYEYDLGGAEHGKTVLSMDREEIYRKLASDLHYFKNVAGML